MSASERGGDARRAAPEQPVAASDRLVEAAPDPVGASAVAEAPDAAGAGAAGGEAYLLLEDGTCFWGSACGASGQALGEVVFTTGMSGYQESMSDPSFAGQLIAFTYPHIGNYGIDARAMESDRIWARAAIMRDARNSAPGDGARWLDWLASSGVPAISEIDTRALVRHIRERGAMRGGLFPGDVARDQALALIAEEPAMAGRDLASLVSHEAVVSLETIEDLWRHLHLEPPAPSAQARNGEPAAGEVGVRERSPLVAVLDTGLKASIARELLERGARVLLYPASAQADELLECDPAAVLLGNGPGDPAALPAAVEGVRGLLGRVPVWGICLGHQLLCRALGMQTFKLPFGHRGANHPVKDLRSGRIAITSQNHGFAALAPGGLQRWESDEAAEWQTDFGRARLSHVNLYDRTVEGIELLDLPGGSVQYHPEAGPGPHDSLYIFDELLALAGVGAGEKGE